MNFDYTFLAGYSFLGATFLAGMFSIGHCSVMCGPLLMIFRDNWIFYHLGRILGYTAVGALLGSIGMSLDRAGLILQIQNVSIYLAVLLMFIYGIYLLFPGKTAGFVNTNSLLYLPTKWISRLKRSHRAPEFVTVFLSGILSALLPCSVLYPVWALSAGAGSPVYGSLIALSFVLGTIPGLAVFQFFLKKAGGKTLRFSDVRIRAVAGIMIVLTGVFMVIYREKYAPKMDFSDAATEDPAQCLPGENQDDSFEIINPTAP